MLGRHGLLCKSVLNSPGHRPASLQPLCCSALKLLLVEMTEHHCKYRGRDDAENYDIDVWVTFD
jgi:hypothetical protein